VKDESLDEYSVKLSTAERELKRLQKEVELLQAQGSRVRELERDNKELQQASVVEHKTLAAIRSAALFLFLFFFTKKGKESDELL